MHCLQCFTVLSLLSPRLWKILKQDTSRKANCQAMRASTLPQMKPWEKHTLNKGTELCVAQDAIPARGWTRTQITPREMGCQPSVTKPKNSGCLPLGCEQHNSGSSPTSAGGRERTALSRSPAPAAALKGTNQPHIPEPQGCWSGFNFHLRCSSRSPPPAQPCAVEPSHQIKFLTKPNTDPFNSEGPYHPRVK